LPQILKSLKEKELNLVLKKSKMGGFIKSDIDTATVKMTPCGTNATFEKTISLGGAKLSVEISMHKACNKKQMEEATVKKPGVSAILPPYEKPATKKA
jgi:hypothetical protein